MKRINITRAATVIGAAGLLGLASVAIAADQKPTAKAPAKAAAPALTNPSSLPKFANVVVVNSTATQRARFAAETSPVAAAGQRVYLDPVTRNIRQITPEDLAAEAAQAPAPASDAVKTEISPAGGGKAILMDESSHAYSVAYVSKSGKVKQACVENQANAEAALQAAANGAVEDSNEK